VGEGGLTSVTSGVETYVRSLHRYFSRPDPGFCASLWSGGLPTHKHELIPGGHIIFETCAATSEQSRFWGAAEMRTMAKYIARYETHLEYAMRQAEQNAS